MERDTEPKPSPALMQHFRFFCAYRAIKTLASIEGTRRRRTAPTSTDEAPLLLAKIRIRVEPEYTSQSKIVIFPKKEGRDSHAMMLSRFLRKVPAPDAAPAPTSRDNGEPSARKPTTSFGIYASKYAGLDVRKHVHDIGTHLIIRRTQQSRLGDWSCPSAHESYECRA